MKRRACFLVAVFVVGLFSLALAVRAEADDIFVWVDGIPGESTVILEGKKGWIDALSFAVQVDRGSRGGKVNSGTLVVSKYLDKATPQLGHYCTSGQLIREVKIEIRKAGKAPLYYMLYKLQNVTVTSVSAGGSGVKRPIEEVTMRFASIEWTYTPQGQSGAPRGRFTR